MNRSPRTPGSEHYLARNFAHFGPINGRETAFLDEMVRDVEHHRAGDCVIAQGREKNGAYVLKSGWSYLCRALPDGSRQVLDVGIPGDIIGMREVAFPRSICSIFALSDVELCPIRTSQLSQLFGRHAQLSAIFFLIGMRREAMLIERVVNLGQRDAFSRLCHFVAELKHRLDKLQEEEVREFQFPIAARLLADILGMSEVHVYRMLKKMHRQDLASFRNGHIRIGSYEKLLVAADFNPDYLQADTSLLARRY